MCAPGRKGVCMLVDEPSGCGIEEHSMSENMWACLLVWRDMSYEHTYNVCLKKTFSYIQAQYEELTYRHALLNENEDVGSSQKTLYILRARNDKVWYLVESEPNKCGRAIDGF